MIFEIVVIVANVINVVIVAIVVNVVIVAIVAIFVNVVIDVSVMIFEIVVNVEYVAKCCKCCKIRFVGHVCLFINPWRKHPKNHVMSFLICHGLKLNRSVKEHVEGRV